MIETFSTKQVSNAASKKVINVKFDCDQQPLNIKSAARNRSANSVSAKLSDSVRQIRASGSEQMTKAELLVKRAKLLKELQEIDLLLEIEDEKDDASDSDRLSCTEHNSSTLSSSIEKSNVEILTICSDAEDHMDIAVHIPSSEKGRGKESSSIQVAENDQFCQESARETISDPVQLSLLNYLRSPNSLQETLVGIFGVRARTEKEESYGKAVLDKMIKAESACSARFADVVNTISPKWSQETEYRSLGYTIVNRLDSTTSSVFNFPSAPGIQEMCQEVLGFVPRPEVQEETIEVWSVLRNIIAKKTFNPKEDDSRSEIIPIEEQVAARTLLKKMQLERAFKGRNGIDAYDSGAEAVNTYREK
ncbi:hypothetical protein BDQ17DRAFT_1360311 [Cyathus striatus]|nr:hypothetical protein BDQ17DRAFT_1360311 [Cyathus striatus]